MAFFAPKRSKKPSPPKLIWSSSLRWFLAGALLSAGPAINFFLPTPDLEAGALTIALALTPVIIAIASSALGTESSEGIAGRIWPGLASLAGLLLVLVQPSLGDLRTDVALVLAPTLSGIGAVLFCVGAPRSGPRVPFALFGATTVFALAFAFGSLATQTRPTLSLLAIAADGIIALLGILTLHHLGAIRWSSQFTWIPLLVIAQSMVLVRPALTAHWITGLVLLMVAGVYLLVPQVDELAPDVAPLPTSPR